MGKCFSRGPHDESSQPNNNSTDQEATMLSASTPGSSTGVQGRIDDVTASEDVNTSNPGGNMVLSEKFLKDIASEIGAEWQLLFVELGLTNAELEQIDFDRGYNQVTKNMKAFLLWRQKNKARHASEQLTILLGGFDEIHRQDLIDKYSRYLVDSNLSQISAYESCDGDHDVNRLKKKLVEINSTMTQEIPLSPIQAGGDKLPIEQLFSSVVVKEDAMDKLKRRKSLDDSAEEREEVKSPDNLLMKNGKPVSNVFMLGDAAHGKTTYCMWLLETWCKTQQPGVKERSLNKWEEALHKFDFVFHIPLRHVHRSRSNVRDMICQDILGKDTVLQATTKHVLESDRYRCFIIIDGLDEWKPSQSVIRQLKYEGMPNMDGMSNCVIFTTMRPWKFSEVAGIVRRDDKVIEIQGLDDKGIEAVIEKVLEHYYELEPDTTEYEKKRKEILNKLENETLKSFIKIPLLAVICVQIWYEGRQVKDTLTSFYSEMTDMLMERALAKMKFIITEVKGESCFPESLSDYENIESYITTLLKLGKIAFDGLLSKKQRLEFRKKKLENEIGIDELQFALGVGLISEREAPSLTSKNVSVHFFHKSVQEFLAAIYIVSWKEVIDSFCEHLRNIDVIMELSNVVTFIYGLSQSLGIVISQHILSVIDSDSKIGQYRGSNRSYKNRVKQLFKLQILWYRELQYGQTDSSVICISDVYLDLQSDKEAIRVTRELLSDQSVDIRSLWFYETPTVGEPSITNEELNDFLSNTYKTRSLVMIHIYGPSSRSVNMVCGPNLRTVHLFSVTIGDDDTVNSPVLSHTDMLQELHLKGMTLHDRDLGLTPNMTELREVTLMTVNMTASGWMRLIHSVIDIQHQIEVRLIQTDIDIDSISTIRTSPHLRVTMEGEDEDDGYCKLEFTRLRPFTKDAQ